MDTNQANIKVYRSLPSLILNEIERDLGVRQMEIKILPLLLIKLMEKCSLQFAVRWACYLTSRIEFTNSD